MKITKISLYHYDWICTEPEGFMLSNGRSASVLPGRVIRIDTDEGITGWGEEAPWGTQYLEMFVGAVQPGLDIIAPELIRKDPIKIGEIYHTMNQSLLGHLYIKAPVDMACWDIFGKFTGYPLYDLLGGMLTEKIPQVPFIMRKYGEHQKDLLESFRKAGINQFCTKASGSLAYTMEYIDYVTSLLLPGESVIMDVNRGWRIDEALMIIKAARNSQFYLEQPCETYEECRDLMHLTGVPIVLCECIRTPKELARAIIENGIGGLNIKLGRVGGITKARLLRDLCTESNIQVWMQSINVSQIGDAATAHLAHSTPSNIIRNAHHSHNLTSTIIAKGGPQVENHIIVTPDSSGLGVEPLLEVLGDPIGVWS